MTARHRSSTIAGGVLQATNVVNNDISRHAGTQYIRSIGPLKLRGPTDDMPQDWWFCATAVPLIAATQGPLSNVLSIAALVNVWRVALPAEGQLPDGADDNGVPMQDPQWEITCNAVSLACGFMGNILLLLHFIGRVRYIVALPLSILFWLLSSIILIAITISLSIYDPPIGPGEIYGQGYWHAVLAAGTYMFGALMLMANMAGYLLGHYPQDFDLNDDQRTLILQTTLYFVWLAGGAAIYEHLERWTYANALYYCHVTILTIGYGDLTPTTTAGRGFLFIYVPIGVIQLGLVISRIARFGATISSDNIVKKHQARSRAMTIDRSVTSEKELRERLGLRNITPARPSVGSVPSRTGSLSGLSKYGKFQQRGRTLTFAESQLPFRTPNSSSRPGGGVGRGGGGSNEPVRLLSRMPTIGDIAQGLKNGPRRKLLILREERDRFNAMRAIQKETQKFKSYSLLVASIIAFAMLWLLGGVIFMYTEARLLSLTYFDSLYFCFVSLLTIGYGDISPSSNLGKPAFIVWSLIAVPSLTILIQSMSDTVVSYVDRKTNWLLPEKGLLKLILDANPKMKARLAGIVERHNAQKRVEKGFEIQDPDEPAVVNKSDGDDEEDDDEDENRGGDGGDKVHGARSQDARGNKVGVGAGEGRRTNPLRQRAAGSSNSSNSSNSSSDPSGKERTGTRQSKRVETQAERKADAAAAAAVADLTEHEFTHQLSVTIRRVARDVRLHPPKKYSFEEWLHFTRLIRFSSRASLKQAAMAARSREDKGALGREEEAELEAVEAQIGEEEEQEEGLAEEAECRYEEEEEDDDGGGVVEWDWIGEDSPMLSDGTEAEWVLDRLCESLNRYTRFSHRRQNRRPQRRGMHAKTGGKEGDEHRHRVREPSANLENGTT